MNSQYIIALFAMILVASGECLEATTTLPEPSSKERVNEPSSAQIISLQVYKTPTCDCCKKWVNHLENQGISTSIVDLPDLQEIKNNFYIAPRYRSCHSAVSEQGD